MCSKCLEAFRETFAKEVPGKPLEPLTWSQCADAYRAKAGIMSVQKEIVALAELKGEAPAEPLEP